jgi:hypothetical protein
MMLVIGALVVRPPAVGWIGFGITAALGLLIGAVAMSVFPRSRANGLRLHPRADGPLKLLVVVDAHAVAGPLADTLTNRISGRAAEVLVVAPVLASPLHFVTGDERSEREDARARLAEALETVGRLGAEGHGAVGDDDPIQAVGDALAEFQASEIVVVAESGVHGRWLEQRLAQQLRDAFGVHVTTVEA